MFIFFLSLEFFLSWIFDKLMKITITRTKNNLEYNYADDLTKINLSSKLTIFVKKL